MATVVSVHGTFAHSDSAQPDEVPAVQWWEPGSVFENELRERVGATDGPINVIHHKWSGDNSERGRRQAGADLLERLRALEANGDPYCVVGHSHGGSVISAALLRAAAKKETLPNLKRWITVGTPFVSLRKERWMFTRLDLFRRVIFVASMMLLIMFLVYLISDLLTGNTMLFGSTFPAVLVVTGIMMSLPALVFYLVLRFNDGRRLLLYRRPVVNRARETFGPRWLSLAHADDEAIQGLAFLPSARLNFFDRTFAVRSITVLSVLTLPLLYMSALLSPAAMTGLANWLDKSVYETRSSPEAEGALRELRQQLVASRTELQRPSASDSDDASIRESRREARRAAWKAFRAKRAELETRIPELAGAERALRFRNRFFERDGKPCDGGGLCGGGRDISINSGLLLHLVTDELSWTIGASELSDWRQRWITNLFLPALVVPILFGLIAWALMVVIRAIGIVVSRVLSDFLNQITNTEVKRAAFGNDTEGEVAIGAMDRPPWLDRSPPRLPAALADYVTHYSNGVASQSFAKFRRAIGRLASAEPKHTADSAITTYFTWKELVHAAYFDVPEFRKLVAHAISRTEGFAPNEQFTSDPDYARAAQWLAEIEGTPGTTDIPGTGKPGPDDIGAVSAVVASTVKAEP
jgi:hypothetical protein